ncbi:protein kinase domain-containing protein [Mycobacterium kansasii]
MGIDAAFETSIGVGDPIAADLSAAGFKDAEIIGRGGFGVVYRCRQVALQREVAVKVLSVELDENRARFIREQQAMARLTGHPNIVPVLQVGETTFGHPFLVMPYCGLGCIQDRIHRLGVLEVAEALRLGVKIAGALASAHQIEILHRDIKPANILLSDYGEPALCDFGISRMSGAYHTATGVVSGSPAFLAPELLGGDAASAASDVYGLGLTLFTALTGHAAFERCDGEEAVAHLLRIATEPPPDLRRYGVPEQVAAVVERAITRTAGDRPSALELGELLQQVQARLGLPVDDMALEGGQGPERRRRHSVVLSSEAGAGGKLPAPVASFVGRGAETTQLHELLSTSRLVTLSGIGGVGKTTLAAQTAAGLQLQFADGVWWVELAELRDGALLTEVIASTLGVRDQVGRELSDVLVDYLAQRQALLVFDNCEHLIDDVAKLADVLLRTCRHLKILATSREVLDIEGEAVLRVAPLPCPTFDGEPTIGALSDNEAVQLFVQRARAAVPGFQLDDHNTTAIARICARVDGLPLAIELAAARMRAMSAEQIAEELSGRYELLTRGRRGAHSRQQSIAACVGWSYDLCTESEQRLWCRLSVLAANFELPAARDICADDMPGSQFLDLVCALVDKSILIRTEYDNVVCFRLLETLRDYGKGRCADAERLTLARCHAGWYHRLVVDAEEQWFSPQQLQWVSRLMREMPNIREALQFNLGDCPARAAEMVAALRRFWMFHGMLSEGFQWTSRALAVVASEPSVARIRTLFTAAHIGLERGDLGAAMGWLTEARQLLEVIDDPLTRGRISYLDGYTGLLTGGIDHGRQCLLQAIASTDDFEVQVASMSALCWMDLICGDAASALAWSQKALALTETRGDWALRGIATGVVGVAHWALGQLQTAEQLLQQAFELSVAVYDTFALANGFEVRAWITESLGQPRQAVVLMAAAAEISRVSGAPLVSSFVGGFHAECERRIREQLSAEEFQAAWDEGSATSMSDLARVFLQPCS